MKTIIISRSVQTQKGAILITSLLILLLLTIIGLGSIQTTTMEEKMAGNNRDRELAFQAAEAALAIGEQEIMSRITENAYGTTTPWHEYLRDTKSSSCNSSASDNLKGTCGPQYDGSFDPLSANWETYGNSVSSNLKVRNSGTTNLKAPSYFIELLRHDPSSGYIFKVHARGYGGNENAVVYLQSTFLVDK